MTAKLAQEDLAVYLTFRAPDSRPGFMGHPIPNIEQYPNLEDAEQVSRLAYIEACTYGWLDSVAGTRIFGLGKEVR